jgi:hypothetical protein
VTGCIGGDMLYVASMSKSNHKHAAASFVAEVTRAGDTQDFVDEAAENLMESLFSGNRDAVFAIWTLSPRLRPPVSAPIDERLLAKPPDLRFALVSTRAWRHEPPPRSRVAQTSINEGS